MHVCFNYNQLGYFKAGCPLLNHAGAIQAPTPATLRIIDGHQGRAEAPMVKGRAFQLMAEEAKEALDIVVGTFLVNSMHALVFYDSRASHSFISLRFSKNFTNAIGDLDHPLKVEIVDDRTVKASKIYRSCT